MAPTTKKAKIQKTIVVQPLGEKSRKSPPWNSEDMDNDFGSLTPESDTEDVSTTDSSQLALKRSEPSDGFESQQQGKKIHLVGHQQTDLVPAKEFKNLKDLKKPGKKSNADIPSKTNSDNSVSTDVKKDLDKKDEVLSAKGDIDFPIVSESRKTSNEETKKPDTDIFSPKSQAVDQSSQENDKAFGDLFKNVLLDTEVRYLEDLDNHPITAPDIDGVMDEELQDELLKDQYHDLPPLPGGCTIASWSDEPSEKEGWTLFKYWGRQNPNLNIKNAMQSIQFVKAGRYINPSRVDPSYVAVRPAFQSSESKRMFVGKDVAICVSPVYSSQSFLLEGKPRGLPQKIVSGIFHSQEWQRFEAFMCLAFSHEVLIAQYKDHALEFGTRSKKSYDASSSRSGAPSGMFGSPSNRTSKVSHRFKPVLDFSDEVIIYDGRKKAFDINNDLSNIANILPVFEGEVPEGSFLIVGYTVNDYGTQKGRCLASSIQWGIVCGTKN